MRQLMDPWIQYLNEGLTSAQGAEMKRAVQLVVRQVNEDIAAEVSALNRGRGAETQVKVRLSGLSYHWSKHVIVCDELQLHPGKVQGVSFSSSARAQGSGHIKRQQHDQLLGCQAVEAFKTACEHAFAPPKASKTDTPLTPQVTS